MPFVPWWALLSSTGALLSLIAGWALGAALQPPGYNPMVESISALAADGASYRWVMTGALFVLGVCHAFTALGLRAAALPGRVTLACGALASFAVALSPEPCCGATSLRHIVSTSIGFTALAVWPVLAAVPGRAPVWALRRKVGYGVTAALAIGAAWFLLLLHGHGAAGMAERVLTGAQSLWPLVVVTACMLGGRSWAPAVTPQPAAPVKVRSADGSRVRGDDG
jgi:hypothetical membrane protein